MNEEIINKIKDEIEKSIDLLAESKEVENRLLHATIIEKLSKSTSYLTAHVYPEVAHITDDFDYEDEEYN